MEQTEEQRAIVAHYPRAGERIVCNAAAGSGKTTTCRWIVERHGLADLMDGGVRKSHVEGAGHRFLYLAFNKSIQAEAVRKMSGLDQVECRTMHSLALEFARSRIAKFHLGEPRVSGPCRRLLRDWFLSDRRELQPAKSDAYLEEAHQAWAKMLRGALPMNHDAYCKLLCVDPTATEWLRQRYDSVICDEAQDTAQVMLDLLQRLPQCVYFIGDQHQAIYAFRNAQNALQRVGQLEGVVRYSLSQSFRFGAVVADLANRLLAHFCVQTHLIRGTGNETRLCDWNWRATKQWAVIGRTNAKVFEFAAEQAHAGKTLSFIVRDAKVVPALQTIQVALAKYTLHKRLQRKRLEEDLAQAGEDGDIDTVRTLKFLRKHGAETVGRMLREIEAAMRPQVRADLLIGTVHSHKGLEWEAVALLDDFCDPVKLQRKIALFCREHGDDLTQPSAAHLVEEINLIYVAITRAKQLLALPPKLRDAF